MIIIHFKCNDCGSEDGELKLVIDEPLILCRKCEEHEPIKDYDIVGYGTEVD